jgi:hypothetical protein
LVINNTSQATKEHLFDGLCCEGEHSKDPDPVGYEYRYAKQDRDRDLFCCPELLSNQSTRQGRERKTVIGALRFTPCKLLQVAGHAVSPPHFWTEFRVPSSSNMSAVLVQWARNVCRVGGKFCAVGSNRQPPSATPKIWGTFGKLNGHKEL